MFYCYSDPVVRALGSHPETLTATEIDNTQPSPSGRYTYQSTLDNFLPPGSDKDEGNFPFNIDEFAEKVASKLAEKLTTANFKHKNPAATGSNPQSTASSSASNLHEYLNESQDFELITEENSRILRCYKCAEFLSSPVSFTSSFRRPSGRTDGSLATGLNLSKEVYEQLIAGKCNRWYHQKEAFARHLVSNTHINAMEFMKAVNEGKSREVVVTKNQLRAALGIIKTKSAAIQYEERIAELHAAG